MIEITTFRLAAGVEPSSFVTADAEAQMGFYNLQPGLLRRTTARSDDGEWVVVTLWASAQHADDAASGSSSDPACLAVADLVDDTTLALRRYAELD